MRASPVPTQAPIIRFPHTTFELVHRRLLEDSPNEAYAVLLGKMERIGPQQIIKVLDVRFAQPGDYAGQGAGHVRLKPSYVNDILCEFTNRLDADTILDVHTHPFAKGRVAFSGIDDTDEIRFLEFLSKRFPDIQYASIVLSQSEYSARVWSATTPGRSMPTIAQIRTQTLPENWPSSDFQPSRRADCTSANGTDSTLFSRAALALGVDTIRRIMEDQRIVVVGVGGVGSAICENLVHMGFHHLELVDPDVLEISNVSRVVGATYDAARRGVPKVAALAEHLRSINPNVIVGEYQSDIADPMLEGMIACADWLIVATDNHSSRLRAQMLSMKYFVPLISAGVNITVLDGRVTDVSGEIITARVGDGLCLNCLGRLNAAKIASETHPSIEIRETLIKRGYVAGADIKEPAVKTLNSVISALLVDVLLNQYTGRQQHVPILVFENNLTPVIYPDARSLIRRNKNCYTCGIVTS